MRVLIAHEWLTSVAGSDKVAAALAHLWPDARVVTTVAVPEVVSELFPDRDVEVLWPSRLPGADTHWKEYAPVLMAAWSRYRVPSDVDVLVSSSHFAAKAAGHRFDGLHLTYCHSPMRLAWRPDLEALRLPRVVRPAAPMLAKGLRRWDRWSARSVNRFVANSTAIARRIETAYGVAADVVFPPVDVDAFSAVVRRPDDYLLAFGRLVTYKRFDLAVEAANRLGVRLIVAGDGPERRSLEALAGPRVEFVGRVSDDVYRELLSGARALLFPGEEDFGIVPVEAMAAGVPVIAYGVGGAADTVIDGVNGVCFASQHIDAMVSAARAALDAEWHEEQIRSSAQRFRRDRFESSMRAITDDLLLNPVGTTRPVPPQRSRPRSTSASASAARATSTRTTSARATTTAPVLELDCRWLRPGGAGTVIRLTLEALRDGAAAGELSFDIRLRGDPERLEPYVWPGAVVVPDRSSPRRLDPLVAPAGRGVVPLWFHHYRPFRPGPAVQWVYDLIQLHRASGSSRAAREQFLRKLAEWSTVVLVPSQASAVALTDELDVDPSKIFMVGLPVDEGRAARIRARRTAPSVPTLVFAGRNAAHKNLVALVDAFAVTTMASNEGALLVLVGCEGPELENAAARANESLGRRGVELAGVVADDELERRIGAATAVVQPSLEEGFGLPVLEALAAGIPVAASRIPAIVEVVESCGPGVEASVAWMNPKDRDSIAAALDRTIALEAPVIDGVLPNRADYRRSLSAAVEATFARLR